MHKPASPLDWRESGDGYTVVDAQGVRVCGVPNGEDRVYIIEAANAYPRLRATLDKALEACRLMFAARRLVHKAYELYWRDRPLAERIFAKGRAVEQRMEGLAREALEMAKEVWV